MTLAHRADVLAASARLERLANESVVLVGLRGEGEVWSWIVVPRIRLLLDRAVDVLAEMADELPDDEPVSRRVRAARAEIDAHLRAADHLSAAGASSRKQGDLLADAVELLAGVAGVAPRGDERGDQANRQGPVTS